MILSSQRDYCALLAGSVEVTYSILVLFAETVGHLVNLQVWRG
jgi:hypothetical protein